MSSGLTLSSCAGSSTWRGSETGARSYNRHEQTNSPLSALCHPRQGFGDLFGAMIHPFRGYVNALCRALATPFGVMIHPFRGYVNALCRALATPFGVMIHPFRGYVNALGRALAAPFGVMMHLFRG